MTLCPPRTEAERRNGFAAWMADKQAKSRPTMEQAIARKLSAEPTSDRVRQIYEQHVRAEAEMLLRTFALRYYTGLWVSRRLGDAVYLQIPEPHGNTWRVPLGVLNYGDNQGQIILDTEGHILEEQYTTRQQLLGKISGQMFIDNCNAAAR